MIEQQHACSTSIGSHDTLMPELCKELGAHTEQPEKSNHLLRMAGDAAVIQQLILEPHEQRDMTQPCLKQTHAQQSAQKAAAQWHACSLHQPQAEEVEERNRLQDPNADQEAEMPALQQNACTFQELPNQQDEGGLCDQEEGEAERYPMQPPDDRSLAKQPAHSSHQPHSDAEHHDSASRDHQCSHIPELDPIHSSGRIAERQGERHTQKCFQQKRENCCALPEQCDQREASVLFVVDEAAVPQQDLLAHKQQPEHNSLLLKEDNFHPVYNAGGMLDVSRLQQQECRQPEPDQRGIWLKPIMKCSPACTPPEGTVAPQTEGPHRNTRDEHVLCDKEQCGLAAADGGVAKNPTLFFEQHLYQSSTLPLQPVQGRMARHEVEHAQMSHPGNASNRAQQGISLNELPESHPIAHQLRDEVDLLLEHREREPSQCPSRPEKSADKEPCVESEPEQHGVRCQNETCLLHEQHQQRGPAVGWQAPQPLAEHHEEHRQLGRERCTVLPESQECPRAAEFHADHREGRSLHPEPTQQPLETCASNRQNAFLLQGMNPELDHLNLCPEQLDRSRITKLDGQVAEAPIAQQGSRMLGEGFGQGPQQNPLTPENSNHVAMLQPHPAQEQSLCDPEDEKHQLDSQNLLHCGQAQDFADVPAAPNPFMQEECHKLDGVFSSEMHDDDMLPAEHEGGRARQPDAAQEQIQQALHELAVQHVESCQEAQQQLVQRSDVSSQGPGQRLSKDLEQTQVPERLNETDSLNDGQRLPKQQGDDVLEGSGGHVWMHRLEVHRTDQVPSLPATDNQSVELQSLPLCEAQQQQQQQQQQEQHSLEQRMTFVAEGEQSQNQKMTSGNLNESRCDEAQSLDLERYPSAACNDASGRVAFGTHISDSMEESNEADSDSSKTPGSNSNSSSPSCSQAEQTCEGRQGDQASADPALPENHLPPSNPDVVMLRVENMTTGTGAANVRMRAAKPMRRLMQAAATALNLVSQSAGSQASHELNHLCFSVAGFRVPPEKTARNLGLTDGSVVTVMTAAACVACTLGAEAGHGGNIETTSSTSLVACTLGAEAGHRGNTEITSSTSLDHGKPAADSQRASEENRLCNETAEKALVQPGMLPAHPNPSVNELSQLVRRALIDRGMSSKDLSLQVDVHISSLRRLLNHPEQVSGDTKLWQRARSSIAHWLADSNYTPPDATSDQLPGGNSRKQRPPLPGITWAAFRASRMPEIKSALEEQWACIEGDEEVLELVACRHGLLPGTGMEQQQDTAWDQLRDELDKMIEERLSTLTRRKDAKQSSTARACVGASQMLEHDSAPPSPKRQRSPGAPVADVRARCSTNSSSFQNRSWRLGVLERPCRGKHIFRAGRCGKANLLRHLQKRV
eukprot:TRINITY_DN5857_c0_g1_i3.p1 TRINITY_DN5857_c0_g1~~TRINITY_DN5857_c0_g1_i3.p1  ORF type:complete len:1371 (-),score=272.37 TRINITY_DN5857_c0_g1_i3:53-4165(-)